MLDSSTATTSLDVSESGDLGQAVHRRREAGDFLRSRRERLKPLDVGLTPGVRRRTPGLRREEVAQLAGVGTTWYAWLEQGRAVNPSVPVLEGLSRALRLDHPERRYLFALTRGEEPPLLASAEVVPDQLRRIVDNLEPLPAYITGRRWDLLAWNKTAAALFNNFGTRPGQPKNIVWTVFVEPFARTLFVEWEKTAQGLIAAVRESSGRQAGDPEFDQLISELCRESAEFCAWWPRYDVGCHDQEPKLLNHPRVGELMLDLSTLDVTGELEWKFTFYVPAEGSDGLEKLRRLTQTETVRTSAVAAR